MSDVQDTTRLSILASSRLSLLIEAIERGHTNTAVQHARRLATILLDHAPIRVTHTDVKRLTDIIRATAITENAAVVANKDGEITIDGLFDVSRLAARLLW